MTIQAARRESAGGVNGITCKRAKKPLPKPEVKRKSDPLSFTGVDSSTVEQRPFKSLVLGSNPSRPTTLPREARQPRVSGMRTWVRRSEAEMGHAIWRGRAAMAAGHQSQSTHHIAARGAKRCRIFSPRISRIAADMVDQSAFTRAIRGQKIRSVALLVTAFTSPRHAQRTHRRRRSGCSA